MTPPSKKNENSISLSSKKNGKCPSLLHLQFQGPMFILEVEVISTPLLPLHAKECGGILIYN